MKIENLRKEKLDYYTNTISEYIHNCFKLTLFLSFKKELKRVKSEPVVSTCKGLSPLQEKITLSQFTLSRNNTREKSLNQTMQRKTSTKTSIKERTPQRYPLKLN